MKKIKLPSWLVCLLFVAATLLLTLHYWVPVTEESGKTFTLTLEKASANTNTVFLNFEGQSRRFRMPYSKAFEPLMRQSAWGKEYEVIADYRGASKYRRGYYDVYALSAQDGTTYLTIEQSEAIRQGMLPKRLGLTLVLDALACILITFRMKHDARAKEETSV